jgi:hypothetical protein
VNNELVGMLKEVIVSLYFSQLTEECDEHPNQDVLRPEPIFEPVVL